MKPIGENRLTLNMGWWRTVLYRLGEDEWVVEEMWAKPRPQYKHW
jgi:hypothetical protein